MKNVMKKITGLLPFLPALVLGMSFVLPTATVGAASTSTTTTDTSCDMSDLGNLSAGSGASCAQGTGTPGSLFGEGGADGGIFKKVVNILLFVIGAVAVIMLIYGGVKYITSGGAQDKVQEAKNTILYAIVGIVVALLAFAVVNFVIKGITG